MLRAWALKSKIQDSANKPSALTDLKAFRQLIQPTTIYVFTFAFTIVLAAPFDRRRHGFQQ
jgi:hypothetical protein